MRRRDLLATLATAMLAMPGRGQTQAQKLPVIGILLQGGEDVIPRLLPEALRDLGYVDGKTIRLEFRSAEGDPGRLPGLAAELVNRKVDLIVASIALSVAAASYATGELPIVMTYVADPVGAGIVASLARPGGNVTGLSSMAVEIAGKQVELLRELIPTASRVAALFNPGPLSRSMLEQIQLAGKALGIVIRPFFVEKLNEIDAIFATVASENVDGLIIQGALASAQTAELGLRRHLATVSGHPAFATRGGLMTYFASPADNVRRAAVFIDKILKGAKPADLPVEQPTKFELVINLKTAKALGLTVPQSLLARASEVIE